MVFDTFPLLSVSHFVNTHDPYIAFQKINQMRESFFFVLLTPSNFVDVYPDNVKNKNRGNKTTDDIKKRLSALKNKQGNAI